MGAEDVTQLYCDVGVAMGCLGNMLFMYWRAPRQAAAIRNVFERMDRLIATRQGPLGILVQLGHDEQLPEGEDRLAIAMALRERSSRIAGVTVVSSRAGLKFTSIRMTLAAIEVLTDRAPELRLCRTVEEGAEELRAMCGADSSGLDVAQMVSAMETVRKLTEQRS